MTAAVALAVGAVAGFWLGRILQASRARSRNAAQTRFLGGGWR